MRNFIITIFIAASAVLSGCATPVDLDVFREGHPGVIRTSQGKFVKAVPIKPKPHKTELVGGTAHALQDGPQHVYVILLAVGPDQVGLAHAALLEDRPHRARVVLGMYPVAHIQPVAVELRLDAA